MTGKTGGNRPPFEQKGQFAQKKKNFQTMGKYVFLFAKLWVIILATFIRRIVHT